MSHKLQFSLVFVDPPSQLATEINEVSWRRLDDFNADEDYALLDEKIKNTKKNSFFFHTEVCDYC